MHSYYCKMFCWYKKHCVFHSLKSIHDIFFQFQLYVAILFIVTNLFSIYTSSSYLFFIEQFNVSHTFSYFLFLFFMSTPTYTILRSWGTGLHETTRRVPGLVQIHHHRLENTIISLDLERIYKSYNLNQSKNSESWEELIRFLYRNFLVAI